MSNCSKFFLILFSFFFLNNFAHSSENLKLGEKIFKKCKACHEIKKEKNKTGPHLINILGRKAGSLANYKKYSKAIKKSGIIWNEETIDVYLKSPKKFIKGGRMAFAGLKKEKDRKNVIAYLKNFSK